MLDIYYKISLRHSGLTGDELLDLRGSHQSSLGLRVLGLGLHLELGLELRDEDLLRQVTTLRTFLSSSKRNPISGDVIKLKRYLMVAYMLSSPSPEDLSLVEQSGSRWGPLTPLTELGLK